MGRRIFKIKGNFMQYGVWSEPDPGFTGKIAVDDDGIFVGWCDELYEFPPEASNAAKVRYLVGVYDESDDSIQFYKLSNDHMQSPLLYEQVVVDGEKVCDWSSVDLSSPQSIVLFKKAGDAKIELEECFDMNDSEVELLVEEAMSEMSHLSGNEFLRDEVLRSGDCPNLLDMIFMAELLSQIYNPERKTFEELWEEKFGEPYDPTKSEIDDPDDSLPFDIFGNPNDSPKTESDESSLLPFEASEVTENP